MMFDDDESVWWQVEIEDESALSGVATARLLALIAQYSRLTHARVLSVEGAGPRLPELQVDTGIVVPIERLLPIVESMVQFGWADFFLTDNEIQARLIRRDEEYADSLRKCSVLVRAVDHTYFYVYARLPQLQEALRGAYPGASTKLGEPENLDYPE